LIAKRAEFIKHARMLETAYSTRSWFTAELD